MQWWFQSQSVKLATEAEAIRDGLLQESFSVRRTLESLTGRENLSTQESQAWLKTLEQFHYSLIDVSDRHVMRFNEVELPRFFFHSGANVGADAGGVQLLLNLP